MGSFRAPWGPARAPGRLDQDAGLPSAAGEELFKRNQALVALASGHSSAVGAVGSPQCDLRARSTDAIFNFTCREAHLFHRYATPLSRRAGSIGRRGRAIDHRACSRADPAPLATRCTPVGYVEVPSDILRTIAAFFQPGNPAAQPSLDFVPYPALVGADNDPAPRGNHVLTDHCELVSWRRAILISTREDSRVCVVVVVGGGGAWWWR